MEVTGPHVGAKLSLYAKGPQDEFLTTEKIQHSFFNNEFMNHSNFTKFHTHRRVYKPSNKSTWPFGDMIKVELDPRGMGDMLANMYIRIVLPPLNIDQSPVSFYADQIGRHLIETIKMKVDEVELEEYHADWGIIYDELFLEHSEKRTKRFYLNRTLAEYSSSVPSNNLLISFSDKQEVVIPIPFFFSRKYDNYERPYFPLCSIYKQKILFEIKFRPQSFFTNNLSDLTIDSFDIITEEITLTNEERIFLTKPRTLITDIVMKHPSITNDLYFNTINQQLVPKIPVKLLMWFLRRESFEDENTHDSNVFANRYNFSANIYQSPANSFYEPVMKNAKIFLNGQALPNINNTDHTYFKYIVPLSNSINRPEKNIYTYSFAFNPLKVESTGSLDFSMIKKNRTTLNVEINDSSNIYSLNIYYKGFKTFNFQDGFLLNK